MHTMVAVKLSMTELRKKANVPVAERISGSCGRSPLGVSFERGSEKAARCREVRVRFETVPRSQAANHWHQAVRVGLRALHNEGGNNRKPVHVVDGLDYPLSGQASLYLPHPNPYQPQQTNYVKEHNA